MIVRAEAKRLLAGYIEKVLELIPPMAEERIGLLAVADVFVGESDDVLRGKENAEQKGRRLLEEGRLTVKQINPGARAAIVAECRGDSGETYTLGYDARRKTWRCTCVAKGKCSHLAALQLVTSKPTEEAAR